MNASDRDTLREEANELLSSLEDFLLELEKVPDDVELVGKVCGELRAAKGQGGDDPSAFTRKVETVYDKVRNGEMRVIRKLVDLTIEARNSLRLIIDGRSAQETALRTTFIALKELILAEAEMADSSEDAFPLRPVSIAPDLSGGEIVYRICLGPSVDLLLTGPNLLDLIEEARDFGKCTFTAHLSGIRALEYAGPDGEYVH